MTLKDSMEWRYAVKKFDTSKEVLEQDLDKVIDTWRLSPRAYWAQPYKLVAIKNKDLREKLLDSSFFKQQKVIDSSHLLVLARKNTFDEKWVDDYLLEISKIREMPIENLDWYKQSYMYFLNSMDENAKIEFAKNMTFLSSGVLISALADAKIDACPMAWFDKKSYDEILWLDKEWFTTEFIVAIWYRAADDEYQNYKKARFSKDILVKKF